MKDTSNISAEEYAQMLRLCAEHHFICVEYHRRHGIHRAGRPLQYRRTDEETEKMEVRVAHSLQSLHEVMRELQKVERMVNRPGLTQRVCLSISDVLQDAMRYAKTCCGQAD